MTAIRRLFLPRLAAALVVGAVLASGCSAPAAAPTAAPAAQPTAAPKPVATTAPAVAPAAASPAAAPAAAASPAAAPATAASPVASAQPVASAVPVATTASAANARPLKIGVGGGVNSASLPIFYAADSGIFAKYGIKPDVQTLNNDTVAMQGLVAKEYDLIFIGASTAIVAASNGAQIKIVDSPSPMLDYSFVAQPGIDNLQQLKGKTLGVSSPGSQSALVPLALLQDAGVSRDDVNIQQIGFDADRGKALIAKTIDASVLNTMVTVQTLKQDPQLHVIANAGAAFSDRFFANAIVARADAVDAQAALLQDAVTALTESARVMQTDKAKFVAYAKTQPSLPADAVEGAYDLLIQSDKPFWGVDGGLSQTPFDATVKSLQDAGQMKTPVTYAGLVTTKFTDQAVKTLGPFKK